MKHQKDKIFEYGQKEGKITHVSNVENGLKCNCICPSCHKKLVAVKNMKSQTRRPHFRHQSRQCDFKSYSETLIHLLAKQIIEENLFIYVPKINIELSQKTKSYLTDIGNEPFVNYDRLPTYMSIRREKFKIKIEQVKVEQSKELIRPDLIILSQNKQLLVEIANTHKVDSEKLKKIQDKQWDAIEIDVSTIPAPATRANIESEILNNINRIKWLNNEKLNKQIKIIKQLAAEIREFIWDTADAFKTYSNQTRVYNCPIKLEITKEKYVEVNKHCNSCPYFIDLIKESNYSPNDSIYDHSLNEYYEPSEDLSWQSNRQFNKGKILCFARARGQIANLINEANGKINATSSEPK